MTPPEDPQVRAQWLAARARVARAHHPDLGGDPEEFIAAMAEVDARFAASPLDLDEPGRLTRLRRGWVRGSRRRRRMVRHLRARLPRRIPGARRYIDL